MMDMLSEMRAEAIAERAKLQAKVEELEAKLRPREVSGEQLVALQERLEAVHAAKLLPDEVMCAAEDLIADYGALRATGATNDEVTEKLLRLVGVSEAVVTDKAFARQAQRKIQMCG